MLPPVDRGGSQGRPACAPFVPPGCEAHHFFQLASCARPYAQQKSSPLLPAKLLHPSLGADLAPAPFPVPVPSPSVLGWACGPLSGLCGL